MQCKLIASGLLVSLFLFSVFVALDLGILLMVVAEIAILVLKWNGEI